MCIRDSLRRSDFEGHLSEEVANLCRREAQSTALVDEGNFRLGGARRNIRDNTSLAIVLGNDLDRFNTRDMYK